VEIGTVEKYLRSKHKERNHKRAAHHQLLLYRWELGRTVEKYLRYTKERNHKEQHITQSLLYRWNWTVEKYSKTKHKERNTKSSTSLNSARWNWVGLLKILLRPNTKKGITKEQHITQSLLYRWKLGRTVEKYSKTKHKKGIKRAAHHSTPAL
jgi:hypothetical protein